MHLLILFIVLASLLASFKVIDSVYGDSWGLIISVAAFYFAFWIVAKGLRKVLAHESNYPDAIGQAVFYTRLFGEQSFATVSCFAIGALFLVMSVSILISNSTFSFIGAFLFGMAGIVIAFLPALTKEAIEKSRKL